MNLLSWIETNYRDVLIQYAMFLFSYQEIAPFYPTENEIYLLYSDNMIKWWTTSLAISSDQYQVY